MPTQLEIEMEMQRRRDSDYRPLSENPVVLRRKEIEEHEKERKGIVDPELVDTMKLRYLARIADALESIARSMGK